MRNDGDSLKRLVNYQFPVGRWLMGIPVTLHWTIITIPLLVLVVLSQDFGYATYWQPLVGTAIFSVLILGFVYLHECGHAFGARLYDQPAQRIMLHGMGGFCYNLPPRTAREELVITFFGPLVNLCFVVLFLGVLFLWEWIVKQPLGLVWYEGRFESVRGTGLELVTLMFLINFGQAAFNLLVPMFPMDCGRILRATLATWYTPLKATFIVMRVAVVTGVLMIAGGVVLALFGEYAQGVPLVIVAMMMMIIGRRYYELAQVQPVYIGSSTAYRVGWQESEEDTEEWKLRGEEKPKPGMIARWLARRQQQREELAVKQAEERRQRVDQLLEKISREGIGALSKQERAFLADSSKSFRNRVG